MAMLDCGSLSGKLSAMASKAEAGAGITCMHLTVWRQIGHVTLGPTSAPSLLPPRLLVSPPPMLAAVERSWPLIACEELVRAM
eukprot:SAG22_NODE_214_length_15003_cov_18.466519_9_plen_83_part_00